jgi:hypothetical protein
MLGARRSGLNVSLAYQAGATTRACRRRLYLQTHLLPASGPQQIARFSPRRRGGGEVQLAPHCCWQSHACNYALRGWPGVCTGAEIATRRQSGEGASAGFAQETHLLRDRRPIQAMRPSTNSINNDLMWLEKAAEHQERIKIVPTISPTDIRVMPIAHSE